MKLSVVNAEGLEQFSSNSFNIILFTAVRKFRSMLKVIKTDDNNVTEVFTNRQD
jgi:hypothetical protein